MEGVLAFEFEGAHLVDVEEYVHAVLAFQVELIGPMGFAEFLVVQVAELEMRKKKNCRDFAETGSNPIEIFIDCKETQLNTI